MSYATSTLAADIRSAEHGEKLKILRAANRMNYLILHHIDRLSIQFQCHQIWYRHLESKHHGIEDSINHLQNLHDNGFFTGSWSPPQDVYSEEHGLKVLTDCLGLACDSLDAEIKFFLQQTGASYRI